MKTPQRVASLFLLLPLRLLSAPADAAACTLSDTQADMTRCAYEEFLTANSAHAAVLKALGQGLAAPDRQRLRTAQKAWIAWRTAECAFEAGGSGSVGERARWTCTATLTRQRTAALEKQVPCPKGELACPGGKP